LLLFLFGGASGLSTSIVASPDEYCLVCMVSLVLDEERSIAEAAGSTFLAEVDAPRTFPVAFSSKLVRDLLLPLVGTRKLSIEVGFILCIFWDSTINLPPSPEPLILLICMVRGYSG
jgi:hypothetical protein